MEQEFNQKNMLSLIKILRMIFSEQDLEYISGSKFSNSYRFDIKNEQTKLFKRVDFIQNLAKDKNVLHLGCADHLHLIEDKIKKNSWLHKRLTETCNSCIGIDIDKPAISLCHKLGYKNIVYCDIFKDKIPKEIEGKFFDYIIIGELLEHVDNPVLFLNQIKAFFSNQFSEILLTGPNAFRWNNTKLSFKSSEIINSDHRYWFTPYTLAKVFYQSNLVPSKYWFVMTGGINKRNFFYKWFLKNYSLFQDTIVISAKPK